MVSDTIQVVVADERHLCYVDDILSAIREAAKVSTNSIVVRDPSYLADKIREGKAVIAVEGAIFVGFCYVETWQDGEFVANSGLIVRPEYRGRGIAWRIKQQVFQLCRQRFPEARIFGLTKSPAVRKMNAHLGYREVPYAQLTTDSGFWKGCSTCPHYHQLIANDMKSCACTAMLFSPSPSGER